MKGCVTYPDRSIAGASRAIIFALPVFVTCQIRICSRCDCDGFRYRATGLCMDRLGSHKTNCRALNRYSDRLHSSALTLALFVVVVVRDWLAMRLRTGDRWQGIGRCVLLSWGLSVRVNVERWSRLLPNMQSRIESSTHISMSDRHSLGAANKLLHGSL